MVFNASASTDSSRAPGAVPFSWSMNARSAAYVESPSVPGRAGGIFVLTSVKSSSIDLAIHFSRNSTPFSAGPNAPLSR